MAGGFFLYMLTKIYIIAKIQGRTPLSSILLGIEDAERSAAGIDILLEIIGNDANILFFPSREGCPMSDFGGTTDGVCKQNYKIATRPILLQ